LKKITKGKVLFPYSWPKNCVKQPKIFWSRAKPGKTFWWPEKDRKATVGFPEHLSLGPSKKAKTRGRRPKLGPSPFSGIPILEVSLEKGSKRTG